MTIIVINVIVIIYTNLDNLITVIQPIKRSSIPTEPQSVNNYNNNKIIIILILIPLSSFLYHYPYSYTCIV